MRYRLSLLRIERGEKLEVRFWGVSWQNSLSSGLKNEPY